MYQYGLYASVYTKDIQRAVRFAKELESGTVAINCTSPVMAFDIAFGGYKQSGNGRQFGQEGLESWLEVSRPYSFKRPRDTIPAGESRIGLTSFHN